MADRNAVKLHPDLVLTQRNERGRGDEREPQTVARFRLQRYILWRNTNSVQPVAYGGAPQSVR